MRLILDAGALVAVERGDRDTVALIKRELQAGRIPVTHGGIVGQVWRGGSGRQANLARLLPALDIASLDESLGRRAGILLGHAAKSDVVDGALVLLAQDEDWLLTSDADDVEALAAAAGLQLDVVPV